MPARISTVRADRPSFDEKYDFLERVKKLPAEKMSELVNAIREQCPAGVKTKDPKKLQVNMDAMGKQDIAVLQTKLDSLMGGAKSSDASPAPDERVDELPDGKAEDSDQLDAEAADVEGGADKAEDQSDSQ